jgi:hypothetical protein
VKKLNPILSLVLLAALAAPLAFGQGVTTVVGQTFPSQLNPATAITSQAGAVTNPSSNFVINITGGPIVCVGGELQYINAAQMTLTANTTNLLVYNCATNPPLYTKTAVTGPGSNGTSQLNQPGNPTSLLFATPGVETALATIVCGSTNCGNTSNGSITDNRNVNNFPIITDWFEFVPAPACAGSVSGNSTGTNGTTTAGGVAVVQDQTSATGTNTHTYSCHIPLPSKLTANKGVVNVLDATFFYGVQTAALGTQVATLASGTLNTVAVFQSTAFPTPAASETASSAYARADSGTAVLTPVVASFNTATTTAGQFYSEKFAPAAGTLSLNTDLSDVMLVVTLQCAATTATITNSPGFIVHYAFIPF